MRLSHDNELYYRTSWWIPRRWTTLLIVSVPIVITIGKCKRKIMCIDRFIFSLCSFVVSSCISPTHVVRHSDRAKNPCRRTSGRLRSYMSILGRNNREQNRFLSNVNFGSFLCIFWFLDWYVFETWVEEEKKRYRVLFTFISISCNLFCCDMAGITSLLRERRSLEERISSLEGQPRIMGMGRGWRYTGEQIW